MPIERERSKRLGAQLDNANKRIVELEVALQTAHNKATAAEAIVADFKKQLLAVREGTEKRYTELTEKIDHLIQVFSLHLNANTDAINILSAKLDFTLEGSDLLQNSPARVVGAKEGDDGSHT